MARIRSLHPGLCTSEEYMALSIPAKAVWPPLWTEADDHGVFEWKPITLKARLMPADNVDMAALLGELQEKGVVQRFTDSGRDYGIIKGFCKWQRPKQPTYRFPFPEDFHSYAAWSDRKPEPKPAKPPGLPQSYPSPTPTGSQRKEEGGRREEVDEEELEEPSSASTAPRKRGADDRGRRLPGDWAPDDDLKALAVGLGLDVDRVLAEFRDYWRGVPGAKGRKLDWPATFRNRCRELAERRGGRQPPGGGKSPTVAQAMDDYRNDPNWKAAL